MNHMIICCGVMAIIHQLSHFFQLAVEQNEPNAQNNLGMLYSKSKFDIFDINKSIYYLTLAANQNHLNALYIILARFIREENIFGVTLIDQSIIFHLPNFEINVIKIILVLFIKKNLIIMIQTYFWLKNTLIRQLIKSMINYQCLTWLMLYWMKKNYLQIMKN